MSLYFHIISNNKNYIKTYLSLNKWDIDNKDRLGRTNLYYAIAYSDLSMVKFIMSFNPSIDIKDSFGLTSVEYAYFYDKLNSTKYLKIIAPDLEENDKKIEKKIEEKIEEKIRIYGEDFLGTIHTRDESDRDE